MKNKKGVIGAGIFYAIIIGLALLSITYLTGGALIGNKLTDIINSVPGWFWIILIIFLFIILMRKKK